MERNVHAPILSDFAGPGLFSLCLGDDAGEAEVRVWWQALKRAGLFGVCFLKGNTGKTGKTGGFYRGRREFEICARIGWRCPGLSR